MDDQPEALLIKPGDAPKVVATLPDELAELAGTLSPHVRITYQTYQHIVTRRADERGWHVEWVLRRMAETIANPTHVGRLDGRPNRIELIRAPVGEVVGVCVSVKLLHAETWVNSAFPFGKRSLQKHLEAGRVVAWEQPLQVRFNKE